MSKYIKPKSLTWWMSVTPLFVGLFAASTPLHGYSAISQSMLNAFGLDAAALINAGLVGIGLRGAIGD